MNRADRWVLPEGVEDLLPEQAEQVERLRRRLLDLFHAWGYRLVIPPLVEYLESLLTGTAEDLDLQTLKVVDQKNGRLMGVRADMTPQVARIDAHRMHGDGPNRLCYIGPVLLARGRGLDPSRSPIQVGAELFGHGGWESDLEVLELLLAALEAVQVGPVALDLGHVGLIRALVQALALDREDEATLFDALERKARPELAAWVGCRLSREQGRRVMALTELVGGPAVIDEARSRLAGSGEAVERALDELATLAQVLHRRHPRLRFSLDLGELRGYHYHTGIVFAAYHVPDGQALALGGRYDHVGEVFGRARPATGFSMDLRLLAERSALAIPAVAPVEAPWTDDPRLHRKVAELRAAGRQVIYRLPGAPAVSKTRLTYEDGHWQLEENETT